MLIVTYDISDTKLRTKFSKYLEKYGYRMQYSVFKIKNSKRITNVIISEIQGRFEKQFQKSDSVLMFKLSNTTVDAMHKFGYASTMDDDILLM